MAEAVSLIDTSDVDRWIGRSTGGGELKEPVSVGDIRRWVQGMHYPNPIHYDEEAATRSSFGKIVAPMSFAVATDLSHGVSTALAGSVPGSHVMYGGDEWWFHGPRILPGDQMSHDRRFVGYTVGDTRFAGPTMFSSGQTVHTNQRGDRVATHRSTLIRFLVVEARERGFFDELPPMPKWSDGELGAIQQVKLDWSRYVRQQSPRTFADTEIGDVLPRRAIGPHTQATLATEWRAFGYQTWGAVTQGHDELLHEAGWVDGMDYSDSDANLDPDLADGMYGGGSSVHVDAERGAMVGIPRRFGWGGAMSAWILDYLEGWAGSHGLLRHTNMQYRFPAFEGDVSYLDGTVIDKQQSTTFGASLVIVECVMSNQNGEVVAKGSGEIELLSTDASMGRTES
jgi:acyl dehydratase